MKRDNFILILLVFAMALSAILKNHLQDKRIEELETRCTAQEQR